MARGFHRMAAIAALAAAVLLPAAAEAAQHTVRVVSDYENLRMYFKPKLLVVQPGDTVVWVNEAKENHNILTFPDGYPKGAEAFSSPFLKEKDETWSYTFTVKGSYEYHCLPHLPMGMHGVIIVGEPSKDSEFHEPSKEEVAVYRTRLLEYFDEDEYQYKGRHAPKK